VPAPGQGIIAIEIRSNDARTRDAVVRVNNKDASCALEAERALVTALGGGCQMPIGAIAVPVGADGLEMHAVVASLDGSRIIRYKGMGIRREATALGRQVAEHLLKHGAGDILREVGQPHSLIPNPKSLRNA